MDDPMARRRRAEQLARQKHPHPRPILGRSGGEETVLGYEVDSESNATIVYTVTVRGGHVTHHSPSCKAWELFHVCSHAMAAEIAESERMAASAAEHDAETAVQATKKLRYVQLPLWPDLK